jgi:hypothetical protein
LVVAGKSAQRQTQLQERVTAIEESRHREEVHARRSARVTAMIDPVGDQGPQLVLTNHGPAEARAVGFTLSPETEGSLPTVIGAEILPLNVLHTGVPMPFPLSLARTECRILLVKVTWTDDAGPQQKPYKLRVY